MKRLKNTNVQGMNLKQTKSKALPVQLIFNGFLIGRFLSELDARIFWNLKKEDFEKNPALKFYLV